MTRMSKQKAATLRRLRALDDPGPDPTIGRPTEYSRQAGFCALCTKPTPPHSPKRRLDPTDADCPLVIVCIDCDETHPRDGTYAFAEATALPRAHSGGDDGSRRRGGHRKS